MRITLLLFLVQIVPLQAFAQEPMDCTDYATCIAPAIAPLFLFYDDCPITQDQKLITQCLKNHKDDMSESQNATLQGCADKFPDCAISAGAVLFGEEPPEGVVVTDSEGNVIAGSESEKLEVGSENDDNEKMRKLENEKEPDVKDVKNDSDSQEQKQVVNEVEEQKPLMPSFKPPDKVLYAVAGAVAIVTIAFFVMLFVWG